MFGKNETFIHKCCSCEVKVRLTKKQWKHIVKYHNNRCPFCGGQLGLVPFPEFIPAPPPLAPAVHTYKIGYAGNDWAAAREKMLLKSCRQLFEMAKKSDVEIISVNKRYIDLILDLLKKAEDDLVKQGAK